jgi:hypothetical protein
LTRYLNNPRGLALLSSLDMFFGVRYECTKSRSKFAICLGYKGAICKYYVYLVFLDPHMENDRRYNRRGAKSLAETTFSQGEVFAITFVTTKLIANTANTISTAGTSPTGSVHLGCGPSSKLHWGNEKAALVSAGHLTRICK